MTGFSGPLIAEKNLTAIKKKFLWLFPYTEIKQTWIIRQAFTYTTEAGEVIPIEEGFETDFASIPEVCGFILQKDGVYSQAAVVHDKIYKLHTFPRKQCDGILYEAMGHTEVPTPEWQKDLIYRHVRWYGRMFY